MLGAYLRPASDPYLHLFAHGLHHGVACVRCIMKPKHHCALSLCRFNAAIRLAVRCSFVRSLVARADCVSSHMLEKEFAMDGSGT